MLSSKEKTDQEVPSLCAPFFLTEKWKGFLKLKTKKQTNKNATKKKKQTHTFHKTAITFWTCFFMKLLIAKCKPARITRVIMDDNTKMC